MTIGLDILAGLLGGMIMGMAFAGHSAVLLTFNPPRALLKRVEQGRIVNFIVALVGGAMSMWTLLGVVGAIVADALIEESAEFMLIPSATYAGIVIAGIIFVGLPVLLIMRDRWPHVTFWLLLALAIYGVLIPNLVIALQNRI